MRNFDLPEGVLEEILSWVPPESLMRFKCVSKSWNALINSLVKDPVFVNKHLHNVHNNPFSCSSFLCFPHLEYCSHLSEDAFDQLSALALFIDSANDRGDSIFGYQVSSILLPGMPDMTANYVCHCNGIICVAAFYGETVLCNPAIKQFRTLPTPFLDSREGLLTAGVGIGYDSRADDYKAIRITFDISGVSLLPRAEIYSMKTDSWREIGFGDHLQLDDRPILDTAVFCKGVVYWTLLNPLCKSNGIVSFDMADDTFRRIPLPDYVGIQEEEIKIAACNDSITLFSYPRVMDESILIRVWMMDDCSNGVRSSCSWIKKPTIGPLKGFAKPWTFWKNDELLMEDFDEGLISYNFQTKMLRNIAIQGVCYGRNRWVFPYVKSLVSVMVENNLSHEGNVF